MRFSSHARRAHCADACIDSSHHVCFLGDSPTDVLAVQRHPFEHLPHHSECRDQLWLVTRSWGQGTLEACPSASTSLPPLPPWTVGSDVLIGTPHALVEYTGSAMLLLWKLVLDGGIVCLTSLRVILTLLVHIASASQEEGADGVRVVELRDGGGIVAEVVDKKTLCQAGELLMRPCGGWEGGTGGGGRQRCLNLGCCYVGEGYDRPVKPAAALDASNDAAHGVDYPPVCVSPLGREEIGAPYRVQNGSVLWGDAAVGQGNESAAKAAVVGNFDSNEEVVTLFWAKYAPLVSQLLPSRHGAAVKGRVGSDGRQVFLASQDKADRFLRDGEWEHTGAKGEGLFANIEVQAKSQEDLQRCLEGSGGVEGGGTDIHMFGDSRMRALSFSVMRLLEPQVVTRNDCVSGASFCVSVRALEGNDATRCDDGYVVLMSMQKPRGVLTHCWSNTAQVNDTDENLKETVVPLEYRDLCGGNKRYDNHVACASKLGFSITTSRNSSLSFHELFHYDHGPTLAAMLDRFIEDSRTTGRRVLLVMAPGFHFVSQAPFDAGSMMASFLPQLVDVLWKTDAQQQLGVWLTMEPTAGGRGAWPEMEKVCLYPSIEFSLQQTAHMEVDTGPRPGTSLCLEMFIVSA